VDEDEENSSKTNGGPWKPQLHFVWDHLLDRLLGKNGSGSSTQEFFRIVVDGSLSIIVMIEFRLNVRPYRIFVLH
jgi:DNA polymerase phi